MILKIFMGLVLVATLYFLFRWALRSWNKADVEQKLEDIDAQEELYKKTTTVDFGEVKAEKKHLDKIKNLKT